MGSVVKLALHMKKNLLYYTIAAIVVGIAVGYFEEQIFVAHKVFIKNIILILAIATIYPSMVQLKVEELHLVAQRKKEIVVGLAVVFLVSPLVAIMLAGLFSERSVGLGFVVSNVVPASSASLGYVLLADGDIELATMLAVLSIVGALIAIPGYLKLYAAIAAINIPMSLVMKIVIVTLVAPLILGQATRYHILKRKGKKALDRVKPALQALTAMTMVVLVFLLIAAKAGIAVKHPELTLEIIVVQSLVLLVLLGLVEAAGKVLEIGYRQHAAIAFISATKNQSVAAAIAVTALGRAAALVPALVPAIQAPIAIAYLHTLLRRRNMIERVAATQLPRQGISENIDGIG